MSMLSALQNSIPSSSNSLKQQIDELIENIRLERKKYHEYTIIKDLALVCCTEDSELSTDVRSKISDVLAMVDLDTIEFTSNKVLGLRPFTTPELTYEDKFQIRNAVQCAVIKMSVKLLQELDELGVTYNDDCRTKTLINLSKEDHILFDFKKELNEKQQLYVLKLEELIMVLEEIVKLKSQGIPNLANEKIHMYELKLQLYSLQSEVLNAKLKASIFKETDSSLQAYEQLMNDVLQQKNECKLEIEELEKLREKYEQVSCKQYNDILRKFLKYKTIVDRKKLLYKKVQEQNI